jgi:hypothetical protein
MAKQNPMDENLQKAQVAAQAAPVKISESVAKLLASQAPPPKEVPTKEQPLGSVTKTEQKRLPKISISYYDKHGGLQITEYTCANLNVTTNTETTLGGNPTSRRDVMNITIEAQVVGVNP